MDGIKGILILQHSLPCFAYSVFVTVILVTSGILFRRWFLLKSAPNEARSKAHTLDSVQKELLSARTGIGTRFNPLADYLCIILRRVETRQPSIIAYVRIGAKTKQDLDYNGRTLSLNDNLQRSLAPIIFCLYVITMMLYVTHKMEAVVSSGAVNPYIRRH
jgi:hypothetical protein